MLKELDLLDWKYWLNIRLWVSVPPSAYWASRICYGISITISVAAVLYINNNRSNPAYKIAWIIPILLMPVFGGIIYLMLGGNRVSARERRRMLSLEKSFEGIHSFDQIIATAEENSRLLRELSDDAANQSEYIRRIAGTPAFRGTSAEYLPLGEVKFRRMLEELEKASQKAHAATNLTYIPLNELEALMGPGNQN